MSRPLCCLPVNHPHRAANKRAFDLDVYTLIPKQLQEFFSVSIEKQFLDDYFNEIVQKNIAPECWLRWAIKKYHELAALTDAVSGAKADKLKKEIKRRFDLLRDLCVKVKQLHHAEQGENAEDFRVVLRKLCQAYPAEALSLMRTLSLFAERKNNGVVNDPAHIQSIQATAAHVALDNFGDAVKASSPVRPEALYDFAKDAVEVAEALGMFSMDDAVSHPTKMLGSPLTIPYDRFSFPVAMGRPVDQTRYRALFALIAALKVAVVNFSALSKDAPHPDDQMYHALLKIDEAIGKILHHVISQGKEKKHIFGEEAFAVLRPIVLEWNEYRKKIPAVSADLQNTDRNFCAMVAFLQRTVYGSDVAENILEVRRQSFGLSRSYHVAWIVFTVLSTIAQIAAMIGFGVWYFRYSSLSSAISALITKFTNFPDPDPAYSYQQDTIRDGLTTNQIAVNVGLGLVAGALVITNLFLTLLAKNVMPLVRNEKPNPWAAMSDSLNQEIMQLANQAILTPVILPSGARVATAATVINNPLHHRGRSVPAGGAIASSAAPLAALAKPQPKSITLQDVEAVQPRYFRYSQDMSSIFARLCRTWAATPLRTGYRDQNDHVVPAPTSLQKARASCPGLSTFFSRLKTRCCGRRGGESGGLVSAHGVGYGTSYTAV